MDSTYATLSEYENDEQIENQIRIDSLPAIEVNKIKVEDPPQDVEILAGPRQFNEGDNLPDEFRELLIKLIYNHAEILDSKPYAAMIESQWQLAQKQAPTQLDLMMMARFHYEELNHGFIFSKILRGLGVDFENFELRQYLFEYDRQDWLDLSIHHFLASKVGVMQIAEWNDMSYGPVANVVPRVFREERGHAGMGYRHLREICGDEKGRAEANERMKTWWPMTLDMFGRTDSTRNKRYRAWGLKKHTNGQLRDAFIEDTIPQIEALGLDVPDHLENRRFL